MSNVDINICEDPLMSDQQKNIMGAAQPEKNEDGKRAKVKEKKLQKRVGLFKRITYFVLSVASLGAWSRYFTVSGKKGGWGLMAFILFCVLVFFIAERYFRDEINSEIKKNFPELMLEIPNLARISEIGKSTENLIVSQQEMSATTVEKDNREMLRLKEQLVQSALVIEELEKDLAEKEKKLTSYKKTDIPKITLVSLDEASQEVGCYSRYSKEKRSDLFNDKYKGKWVRWTGKVQYVDNDQVIIVGVEGPGAVARADLKSAGSGYELLKDDLVSMTMTISEQGDCDKPFVGINAFVNQIKKVG